MFALGGVLGVLEKNKEQGHSGPLADEGREGKEAPRTKGLRATIFFRALKGVIKTKGVITAKTGRERWCVA